MYTPTDKEALRSGREAGEHHIQEESHSSDQSGLFELPYYPQQRNTTITSTAEDVAAAEILCALQREDTRLRRRRRQATAHSRQAATESLGAALRPQAATSMHRVAAPNSRQAATESLEAALRPQAATSMHRVAAPKAFAASHPVRFHSYQAPAGRSE